MKRRVLVFFILMIFFAHGNVQAQCDYKIKVTSKTIDGKGEISVKLNNSKSYRYVLYAYEGGNKLKIEEKSGNDTSIQFKGLAVNRYYGFEIYFKREDKFLCSSWASDLIQIKE